MKIEVTQKDLDNLTGFIKIFGVSHFKDISGQQCLAHIRLLEGIIDISNRIVKAKDEKEDLPIIEAIEEAESKDTSNDDHKHIKKISKKAK